MGALDDTIAAGLAAAGAQPQPAVAEREPEPAPRLGRRINRSWPVQLGTRESRGLPSGRGQEPHVPTDLLRRQVAHFVAMGVSVEKTATLVGVSRSTLHKHYRHEIDTAADIADLNVAANLFKVATSDAPQAAPAAQFWLSRRSKAFKEVKAVELTGKDGRPIEIDHRHAVIDARQLSPEERAVMRDVIARTMESETTEDAEYEEINDDDDTAGDSDDDGPDESDG